MTIKIGSLLTEYADAPLGIDTRRPRLSWKLEYEERGQLQTAYRVLVAANPRELEQDKGDMWDSGRIESGQSVHVHYEGSPLASGAHYYWKVRVWDKQNVPSEWSRASSWSMGPLDQADWLAKWIGLEVPHSDEYRPVAYLRKPLDIGKPVKRAIVHATALGLYRLFIGGRCRSAFRSIRPLPFVSRGLRARWKSAPGLTNSRPCYRGMIRRISALMT
ncbi:glycoside hydrolase family 78 protein [Paenibacillus arenilitoris]|uniref:Alpha-L-rhamnosidase n=1 Tax=Paenibacillus arenilitoris TaxID=2772299 RepID=A0A927CL17_9BACL|nr:hypothetical protein [Paenibacillus arenilitoris]MBD2868538.1 hypothetical protein [Paenibacillus arenilitoris]